MRFFEGINKRDGSGLKLMVGELREQTQAQRFGGDRGTVGKKKDLARG
jgi:hypothetical protein